MPLGDTVSKNKASKLMKEAGYIYGTAEYAAEYRRCYLDDGSSRLHELDSPRAIGRRSAAIPSGESRIDVC